MSGETAASCCCQPGEKAIIIDICYEAAVNRMYSNQLMGFYECADQRGKCVPPCDEIWGPSPKLEWNCGLSYYLGDFIQDPNKWMFPSSWTCLTCGPQNIGNCGCGYDDDGNPTECCGPECNQVGQYTGWGCVFPGEREFVSCNGGCSCGCVSYDATCCFDNCCPGQSELDCICKPPCNDQMCKVGPGERQSAWHLGSWWWKAKSYIERCRQYRFDWYATEIIDEDRSMSVTGCNGNPATVTVQVRYTADVYIAPPLGWAAERTTPTPCETYGCWDRKPGPNIGADTGAGLGFCNDPAAPGSQYIKFLPQPTVRTTYGISLRQTNTAGVCNAVYEAVVANGQDLDIYRNGVLLGTVNLLQTRTQVAADVAALTNNCVTAVVGLLSPGALCLGPVLNFALTVIPAAGSLDIVKQGMQAGDTLDSSIFGIQSEYRACTHGYAPTDQIAATDDPAICDFYQVGSGPLPFFSYPYVDTAGTYGQWQQGFEAKIPTPVGCFNMDSCLGIDPVWQIVGFPNIKPDGFLLPDVNVVVGDDGVPYLVLLDGCTDPSCLSPRIPAGGNTPNEAYNIPCPWNGTEADKAKVQPIGTNSVSELIYSDFGCCDARDGNCNGTNYDCTKNMETDVCCQQDAECPNCPTTNNCQQNEWPQVCYPIAASPACEAEIPGYCNFHCCCTCLKPWYRNMNPENHGCLPASIMGWRLKWHLRRLG